MPKHPESVDTLRLTLELLRRIPQTYRVTASELHGQLERAGFQRELRTIQRQLNLLCDEFDIECDDRNKPYSYRWAKDARMPFVAKLTPGESLLLSLAEQHLKCLLPDRLMKSMQGFFKQARRNLGPDSNAKLEREWIDKVRVVATSQPLLPPKVDPEVFANVSQALFENRWLSLDYQNASGQRGEVEVMPLGLAQQGPRLYLVGRYRGYEDERSLALHRMRSARVTTFQFTRPKNFDLARYDQDGRFGFGEGKLIRLSFRIEREAGFHLLETPLAEDQSVVELDDDLLEIRATVVDSAMLEWWLRGFGTAITQVRRRALPASTSKRKN